MGEKRKKRNETIKKLEDTVKDREEK